MKRRSQADQGLDAIRSAASLTMDRCYSIADEIDAIISESLGTNSPRALRAHLRQLGRRLRDAADALARELDNADADPETLSLLVRVAKRAGTVFLAGAIFVAGGAATGAVEELGKELKGRLTEQIEQLVNEPEADPASPFAPDAPPGSSPQKRAPAGRRGDSPHQSPAQSLAPEQSEDGRARWQRYLEASAAKDRQSQVDSLTFLLSIEALAKEVLLEQADVIESLPGLHPTSSNPIAGTEEERRAAFLHSLSRATLRDVLNVLRQLVGKDVLPVAVENTIQEVDLREIVELRNRYAHGALPEPGSGIGSADDLRVVADALQLWEALHS